MEEIEFVKEQILNEMAKTDERKYTVEELMAIEAIRKVKNPFRMITVKDVMRDLNICETIAYRTFRREDFPSINIGKTNQVMLLPYLIWKMQKRDQLNNITKDEK